MNIQELNFYLAVFSTWDLVCAVDLSKKEGADLGKGLGCRWVSPWQEGLIIPIRRFRFSVLSDLLDFSVDSDGELTLGSGVGRKAPAV